ncbi:MAG: hypothetical protein K8R56_09120 [Candidatus Eisenbacteria bacterium]|nr:hypothetical protein [Candidatus Eisenbacteria bacterium]
MSHVRAISVPPPRVHSSEAQAWLGAAFVALLWWQALWAGAQRMVTLGLPPLASTLLGLTLVLLAAAAESAIACGAWRALGRTPGWGALTLRVFGASVPEAFAAGVLAGAPLLSEPWPVWLCGVRAAEGWLPGSGTAFAFAGFGLLTVLRLALSAHAQARLARAPLGHGMLVVLALYLLTRLIMLWSFDLMQGHSFEPWGVVAWPATSSLA